MNGHIDLTAVVLGLVGGIAAYAAYRDPNLGAALLVGAGVVTVLYLLLKKMKVRPWVRVPSLTTDDTLRGETDPMAAGPYIDQPKPARNKLDLLPYGGRAG